MSCGPLAGLDNRGNQMKVRFLALALIVSFLLINALVGDSVLAQRPTKNRNPVAQIDRWYVFVSPDGDFTLSFPQRPSQEPDERGPETPIRSFGLNTQNGMRFSINSQGSFREPNPRLANEWNDHYEQGLLSTDRKNKRRVISTRRLGKNGFEAEVWDASSDSGESINYIRQTILRQGRIYTLVCGSAIYGRRADKSICRQFFSSLNFITESTQSSR
jgi:hypothetical protein